MKGTRIVLELRHPTVGIDLSETVQAARERQDDLARCVTTATRLVCRTLVPDRRAEAVNTLCCGPTDRRNRIRLWRVRDLASPRGV